MNQTDPENSAVEDAFQKMADRMATLSDAVDRFAGRQQQLLGRDYSEDFARIELCWKAAHDELTQLKARPVLSLTPQQTAQQIEVAGKELRAADHQAWSAAQGRLEGAARSIDDVVASARSAREQKYWVAASVGVASILAFIAGCTLPPSIDRSMPESWHWPERRAAALLQRDLWGAGARLMQTQDRDRWNTLTRASHLYSGNETEFTDCEKRAVRTKKTVSCTVQVSGSDTR